MPSKSLLASSKSAHAVSKAKEFGVNIDGKVNVDMKAIKNRVDNNIKRIYDEDDSPEALKKLGVDVISGAAMLKESKVISVANNDDNSVLEICAKDGILIATGAKPRKQTISGIDQVDYITY